MITIARGSRGICVGDSLMPGFGGSVSPLLSIGQAIATNYGGGPNGVGLVMPTSTNPFQPSGNKLPYFGSVDGQAGRACLTIAASAGAFVTYCQAFNRAGTNNGFDFAIVQLGINDADNIRTGSGGATLALTLAAQLVILDGLVANLGVPVSQILWLGPWSHDSGDDLTQINSLDSTSQNPTTGGFQGQCNLRGATYCQLSLVSSNPIGTTTTGDGTHPSLIGQALIGAFVTQPNVFIRMN